MQLRGCEAGRFQLHVDLIRLFKYLSTMQVLDLTSECAAASLDGSSAMCASIGFLKQVDVEQVFSPMSSCVTARLEGSSSPISVSSRL